MHLHWFRSDLRIYDNPALLAASQKPLICVYFLSEKQWDAHAISPAKRSLIVRQLQSLASNLGERNIPLHIVKTRDFGSLAIDLLSFSEKYKIEKVFFNAEYELNEARCAAEVEKSLNHKGIACEVHHDQCLIKPGEIRNQQGEMFKVYTAFKRQFFKQSNGLNLSPLPAPNKQAPLHTMDIQALDQIKLQKRWQTLWPAGEDEAHKRLQHFLENRVDTYHQDRDIPSLDGTSVLSPYLAVGALSVRQCAYNLAMTGPNPFDENHSPGSATWYNELIWREFYRHLIDAFPRLCKHRAFIQKTETLPWSYDQDLFSRWCAGETGYPLVDAAMKQLQVWGWMHNRLRMVVAMFLTKHLFIDWRLGEKFFMENLVDGDFASNNGGWQWSASTGVDAQPWFRIFNPYRQSERFDTEGKFIRAYLPQLSNLSDKAVHSPSPLEAASCGYPSPIVDHKLATQQTKAMFKSLG